MNAKKCDACDKTLDEVNVERQSDRQRKVRKLRLNRSSGSATKSFIVHEFFCIWPPPPFTQISTRKTFQKPSRQHQVKNFLEIFQSLAKKKLQLKRNIILIFMFNLYIFCINYSPLSDKCGRIGTVRLRIILPLKWVNPSIFSLQGMGYSTPVRAQRRNIQSPNGGTVPFTVMLLKARFCTYAEGENS